MVRLPAVEDGRHVLRAFDEHWAVEALVPRRLAPFPGLFQTGGGGATGGEERGEVRHIACLGREFAVGRRVDDGSAQVARATPYAQTP